MEISKKLKNIVCSLFKKERNTGKREIKKINKNIKRVELLKLELNQVTNAYDKKIEELKATHISALWKYEQSYQKLRRLIEKQQQGLIEEEKVNKQREEVKPFEQAFNEVNEQLIGIKEHKKDSVMNIISEIDQLQENYTKALAEEIKTKSLEMAKQRQEYLKEVQSLGYDYKKAIDTERLLKETFEKHNFVYKETMVDSLAILTKDVPISIDKLAIAEDTVNEALIGKIPYVN
ncbi:hypothetical protein COL23_11430 [Priestia aryabhattai]|uniref:hypothetical protein n=1 Tax=Priestia aryabhattai TaxID=412384 RepID=UPI000BF6545E|nr:hypothetical protein [Priestia aryabhattai]PFW76573.1 hypothetical protein COL23_11430 [Priestia aryabhattai]